MKKNHIVLFLFMIFAISFVACGGGGGNGGFYAGGGDSGSQKIDGLIALYSFDELFGNMALDASGNGNHGVITAASRVEGRIGEGLLFGFDNARVRIDNSLFFNEGLITIEAWIKPYEMEPGAVYRIIGDYNYHDFYFQIRDSRLEILYEGQSYHYGTVTIQPDVWTHIAFTSDGTDIVTYINGVEDGRTNITLPIKYIANIRIGAHWIYTGGSPSTDYVEEFPGTIDEMRIWDIARTSDEIIGAYDQQLIDPPTVSTVAVYLVSLYAFNESTGIIAYDTSGNNNNGIITGASRVEGKDGNALLFGADDARVRVDNTLYLNDGLIMLEAWIKPYEMEPGEVYRIIGDYNYHGFYFQIRDGRLEILYEGQSYHYGTVTIQPDVWTHIAFTSEGRDIVTYINGVEDGRTNITLPIKYIANIHIGAHEIYTGGSPSTGYVEEFPGIIDEMGIWGGVLYFD